jgi:hypothetical protein
LTSSSSSLLQFGAEKEVGGRQSVVARAENKSHPIENIGMLQTTDKGPYFEQQN